MTVNTNINKKFYAMEKFLSWFALLSSKITLLHALGILIGISFLTVGYLIQRQKNNELKRQRESVLEKLLRDYVGTSLFLNSAYKLWKNNGSSSIWDWFKENLPEEYCGSISLRNCYDEKAIKNLFKRIETQEEAFVKFFIYIIYGILGYKGESLIISVFKEKITDVDTTSIQDGIPGTDIDGFEKLSPEMWEVWQKLKSAIPPCCSNAFRNINLISPYHWIAYFETNEHNFGSKCECFYCSDPKSDSCRDCLYNPDHIVLMENPMDNSAGT